MWAQVDDDALAVVLHVVNGIRDDQSEPREIRWREVDLHRAGEGCAHVAVQLERRLKDLDGRLGVVRVDVEADLCDGVGGGDVEVDAHLGVDVRRALGDFDAFDRRADDEGRPGGALGSVSVLERERREGFAERDGGVDEVRAVSCDLQILLE